MIEVRNKLLVVTGVSGSGKNYIAESSFRQLGDISGLKLFDFGSELFKVVRDQEKAISSRDQLRHLSIEAMRYYTDETINYLVESCPAIVIYHLMPRQGSDLSVSPWDEKKIAPERYVFVRTKPALIQHYRQSEGALRTRPKETIEEIALHQKLALASLAVIARHTKTQYVIADNKHRKLDAVHVVVNQARKIFV